MAKPLAQQLREAMVRRKLSHKQAANIAGVSDKTIQRILGGARPTAKVLGGILKVVGGDERPGLPPEVRAVEGEGEGAIFPQASIAVLPFANLSGAASFDVIADGLVEEILTSLAQFSELHVIARNSVLRFKGEALDIREIGTALGVRYVLEGSVRGNERTARVVAQLIDAQTGAHLWANRFDRPLQDVLQIQDEIAAAIASRVVPNLWRSEIGRMRRSSTRSLDAWGLAIRAWTDYLAVLTPDGAEKSLALARRAVALDSNYGFARVVLACLLAERGAVPTSAQALEDRNAAEAAAAEALRLSEHDPLVLLGCSYVRLRLGRVSEALPLLERAYSICPGHAYIRCYRGLALLLTGRTKEGVAELTAAEHLAPVESVLARVRTFRAAGLFELGQDQEAFAAMSAALSLNPNYFIALALKAAMLANAGQLEEARMSARHAETTAGFPFAFIAAAMRTTFAPQAEPVRLSAGFAALLEQSSAL